MSQDKRAIIELEIASLERSIDKYNADYLIIGSMIDDLISDKLGIASERLQLLRMIVDRKKLLDELNDP